MTYNDGDPGMTPELARRVWAILVEHAGASNDPRDADAFVYTMNTRPLCTEYRFVGSLGFGGKFRRANGRWYIDCYQEHETPKRRAVALRKNRLRRPLTAAVLNQRSGF